MMKGKILALVEGVIVVPYEEYRGAYWDCVVVGHTDDAPIEVKQSYPVGGYNITVPTFGLLAGREVSLAST